MTRPDGASMDVAAAWELLRLSAPLTVAGRTAVEVVGRVLDVLPAADPGETDRADDERDDLRKIITQQNEELAAIRAEALRNHDKDRAEIKRLRARLEAAHAAIRALVTPGSEQVYVELDQLRQQRAAALALADELEKRGDSPWIHGFTVAEKLRAALGAADEPTTAGGVSDA